MDPLFDTIMAIRDDPKSIAAFAGHVLKLLEHLTKLDGVFRGTHEAVLAEAQGGEILDGAGQKINHLGSLRQDAQALLNREGEIMKGIRAFSRFSTALGDKVKEVVQPLLNRSQEMRALAAETEAKAAELARTDPTRLQGVPLARGGLGTAVGRTEASLVSNQLAAQAAQLRARGIQPTLLPNPGAAAPYLARVRQAALNNQDATVKVVPILTAMRMAGQRALTQAGAAMRALFSTVLDVLMAALDALALRLGSMLTTPLLIPDSVLKSFRQDGGIEA